MGDRVSISFVRRASGKTWEYEKGDLESVTIGNHWGGMTLVELAKDFIESLGEPGHGDPISRREPSALIAPFINMLEESFASDLRVVRSPKEYDNSDRGHWQVDVYTGKAKKIMEAEKNEERTK